MLYRFKSQSAAEVILFKEPGEEMLSIMGKAASPQGVITLAQMPAAILALKQAIQQGDVSTNANLSPQTGDYDIQPPIHINRRLVPMITLLQQSLAGRQDVVWGV